MSRARRCLIAAVSVLLAAAIYLPSMHWWFQPATADLAAVEGLSPLGRKLANHQIALWTTPELLEAQVDKMRSANAEWDFMGRSFLAWSLANIALREPALMPDCLGAMDRIIDQTLQIERERGMYFFLMPYARAKPWVQRPERSLFLDGEIALMLAMRCVVENKPEYRDELRRRVDIMVQRMESSPSLSAESYPDECWSFCNVTALAAIRVGDYLDGTDHADLIRRWLAYAKGHLLDPDTGMLVSAYRLDGTVIYPSEGSSIWYVSHGLALLDEPFGREQYELAKRHLARSLLGFGYCREWPEGADGQMDVDSGLVVPGTGASVASSGLCYVAAGTYGDREQLRRLATSVAGFGFPVERDGSLYHAAGNQVGDAVMLYGLTAGPVWQKVKEGRQ